MTQQDTLTNPDSLDAIRKLAIRSGTTRCSGVYGLEWKRKRYRFGTDGCGAVGFRTEKLISLDAASATILNYLEDSDTIMGPEIKLSLARLGDLLTWSQTDKLQPCTLCTDGWIGCKDCVEQKVGCEECNGTGVINCCCPACDDHHTRDCDYCERTGKQDCDCRDHDEQTRCACNYREPKRVGSIHGMVLNLDKLEVLLQVLVDKFGADRAVSIWSRPQKPIIIRDTVNGNNFFAILMYINWEKGPITCTWPSSSSAE